MFQKANTGSHFMWFNAFYYTKFNFKSGAISNVSRTNAYKSLGKQANADTGVKFAFSIDTLCVQ